MKKDAKKKTAVKAQKAEKPAKVGKSDRFSVKELQEYRNALLALRTKIAGDLEHLESDALNKSSRDASGDLSGYTFHMADMATDNFDREFNLGLAANEQELLNQIDGALRKIDEGTYGICEMLGKPIPVKRLKAMPYARYCIEAQQQIEERNRRRA